MSKPQLLWVDLEMTGLNALKDRIIEIAALLTDFDLKPITGSQFHRIMKCEDSILASMDEWCTNTHGKSGLTAAVKASRHSIESVESELLTHLKAQGCVERTLLLAGNSIHADRHFMTLQMPTLISFLHYREIDVSSFNLVARSWRPDIIASLPGKKYGHRAMDDILESIEELRHYKDAWLSKQEQEQQKNKHERKRESFCGCKIS